MFITECPTCDEVIWFEKRPKLQQPAVCPYCRQPSKVVSETPLELEPDLEAVSIRDKKRKRPAKDVEFRILGLEDQENRDGKVPQVQKSWRSHQAQKLRERADRDTDIAD